jgi:DNA-directed RNA polymerase specialized sigma24 family protein
MIVEEREQRWTEAMRAERRGDVVVYERMLKEVATALRRSLAPRLARVGLGAHEAEDLVQEILIGLHGKRHSWDPARPFMPWLHAITRYKLIDFTRHPPLQLAPASSAGARLMFDHFHNRRKGSPLALRRMHAPLARKCFHPRGVSIFVPKSFLTR